MKHVQHPHRGIVRFAQTAIACAAFALVAGCGGGSSNNSSSSTPAAGVNMQVVSFGTSLSDAGTYSPTIQTDFGGGRFTTNPGEVWTQKVSEYFGNSLTPAFEGGFGLALSATGGLDYSQGGAMVYTGGVSDTSAVIAGASEQPISWQITEYLQQHSSFNANQIVLVEGGANEILALLDSSGAGLTSFGTALAGTSFSTLVATPSVQASTIATLEAQGFTATQAAALVPAAIALELYQASPSSFSSITPILSAATELATLVNTKIAGTPKTVVVTVPDIGKTPAALAADAAASATPGAANSPDQALSLVTAMYNLTLLQGLATSISAKTVIPVDTFSWLDSTITNASSLGFSVTNTATACNLTQMQANATAYATANPAVLNGLTPAEYGAQFASSLFCSAQTLVAANAPTTYMFADLVHPTTELHAQFAAYVETQLAAAGIGKAP